MINIRSQNEIDKIWDSCQIVKDTLLMLEEHVQPGVATIDLDRLAEEFIRRQHAIPGFKGLYGFPATLCISINDEVVHGIPGSRRLKDGEMVSVDVGALKNNYYGDHAKSFAVGQVSKQVRHLMKITRESLEKGIAQAVAGNRIGDISFAVQTHAERHGYSVVRELCGHGIGTDLHEEPQIPNYGKVKTGPVLQNGMCLAIEPMINMGKASVYTKSDNWTVCTADGKPSAHFEHTIAVTQEGPKVLTV